MSDKQAAIMEDPRLLGCSRATYSLYVYIRSLTPFRDKPVVELICEDYQLWIAERRSNGKPYGVSWIKQCLEKLVELGLVEVVRQIGTTAWWLKLEDG